MEREQLKRENERRELEERAAQEARSFTVHAANPIRHYKALPPRQILPLTLPKSPNFSDKQSKWVVAVAVDLLNLFHSTCLNDLMYEELLWFFLVWTQTWLFVDFTDYNCQEDMF